MTTLNILFTDAITIDNQAYTAGQTAAISQRQAELLILSGQAVVVDSAGANDVDAFDVEATQAMADELVHGSADGNPEDTPGAIEI